MNNNFIEVNTLSFQHVISIKINEIILHSFSSSALFQNLLCVLHSQHISVWVSRLVTAHCPHVAATVLAGAALEEDSFLPTEAMSIL